MTLRRLFSCKSKLKKGIDIIINTAMTNKESYKIDANLLQIDI